MSYIGMSNKIDLDKIKAVKEKLNKKGDLKELESLLTDRIRNLFINKENHTLLYLALTKELPLPYIKLLITDENISYNESVNKLIPLHYAINNNLSIPIIKLLINKSNINLLDEKNHNALQLLLLSQVEKTPELIKLLTNPNDLHHVSKFGNNLLHTALHNNCKEEVVSLYINSTSIEEVNGRGENALMISLYKNYSTKLIKSLITKNNYNQIDTENYTSLAIALINGKSYDIIKLLVSEKSIETKVTAMNMFPVVLAIKYKLSLEIIKLLINNYIINYEYDNEHNPLFYSIILFDNNKLIDSIKLVELFINNISIRFYKKDVLIYPIHSAIVYKLPIEIISKLIFKGVLDKQAINLHTPLMMAIQSNYDIDCISLLISDTNLDTVSSYGDNVLHIAVAVGLPKNIIEILKSKNNINTKNYYGINPYEMAIEYNLSKDIIKSLKP